MNLSELLRRSAQEFSNSAAVGDRYGEWTYAQLDSASEVLAQRLRELGIGKGHRVATFATKSREVVAALQAVLRVGAAYIPIDPTSPVARMRTIAEDAQISLLWVDGERHARAAEVGVVVPVLEQLPSAVELDARFTPSEQASPKPPAGEHDLAYVLYTSGSTGVPKGVCISHRNALAFALWAAEAVGAGPKDVFSNHAQFHFDLSVFDLYSAFAVGACVRIVPDEIAYMGSGLVDFIRQHSISVWYSVPSALTLALEDGLSEQTCPSLRTIIFAGEVFPMTPLRQLRQAVPEARMFNFYGPTETNVCASFEVPAEIATAATCIPIGRAASGARFTLKPTAGVVPASAHALESGELLVEGPTVMLGYWGKPPQQGAYATGDMVWREADGELYYAGRLDGMVKIRGFRVELGEIEAAIEKHPQVVTAIACVLGDGPSAKLGVLAECRSSEPPSLLELKAWSATLLPRYMILDKLRVVGQIPRTSNGKRDRKAARPFFD